MGTQNPDSLVLAYLAGFVDGEGCLTFVKRNSKTCRTPQHAALLSIVNTRREVLEIFLQRFGGRIKFSTMNGQNPNAKDIWEYRLHSRAASNAMKQLLPYLILKRDIAELIIAYAKTNSVIRYNRAGIPPFMVEHRLSLVARVKKLNQRGRERGMSYGTDAKNLRKPEVPLQKLQENPLNEPNTCQEADHVNAGPYEDWASGTTLTGKEQSKVFPGQGEESESS